MTLRVASGKRPSLPFPPLSRVAADPWIEGSYESKATRSELTALIDAITQAKSAQGEDFFFWCSPASDTDIADFTFAYDASALFEGGCDALLASAERLSRSSWSGAPPVLATLRDLRVRVRKLHRLAGSPTPYYALLEVDGDRIGTLLSEQRTRPPYNSLVGALDEFVSLDVACELLLGACAKLPDAAGLAEFEGRVHVSINAESQTAEPAALFSSSGVRHDDAVTIGVEITAPRDDSKSLERVFVLGGESRVVARREGKGFPAFSDVCWRYEEALKRHAGEAPLLLLMLATPASYSNSEHDLGAGWIPPWLSAKGEVDGLAGLRFELVSIATDRFVPVSGWSLATRPNGATQGVQRAVRRLVPAGTEYALRVVGGGADAYLRACERFWWRPIDESVSGNAGAHLAAPHRDGYGLVLPGLWWPTQRR